MYLWKNMQLLNMFILTSTVVKWSTQLPSIHRFFIVISKLEFSGIKKKGSSRDNSKGNGGNFVKPPLALQSLTCLLFWIDLYLSISLSCSIRAYIYCHIYVYIVREKYSTVILFVSHVLVDSCSCFNWQFQISTLKIFHQLLKHDIIMQIIMHYLNLAPLFTCLCISIKNNVVSFLRVLWRANLLHNLLVIV